MGILVWARERIMGKAMAPEVHLTGHGLWADPPSQKWAWAPMRTARAAAILMPEERPSLHADGSSGCSGLTPPSPAPWRPLTPLDHTATSGVARHRGDAASAAPRPAVAADVRPPPACVSPAFTHAGEQALRRR